jgi:ferredoxin
VLPPDGRTGLTLRGKVKGFVHGWKQAFATNASACEACGRCVEACPEGAIRLERAQPGSGTAA